MISTENGPQDLTYDQYKAKRKRREITHTILTDDDAVEAYKQAQQRLKDIRFTADADTLAAAQADLDDAERAVRDSAITFRLRALPRKGDGSFSVLKAEHPPTEDDNRKVQESTGNPKDKAVWHTDTFAPALVAACLVSPAMTVEQAAAEAQDMNDAEWAGLYLAALSVNQQATDTAGLIFS